MMYDDDDGLDKSVINRVMRSALLRLHVKNVYVVDILHELKRDYQIQVTRAKFDDWFMTRPERKKFAPLPVFEAVVKVLFSFDANVLDFTELKQLLDARGIPALWLNRFASLLSNDDWDQLLQSYNLLKAESNTQLFGRDDILYAIDSALKQQRCIVLTGEKGIGKSCIVTQSIRNHGLLSEDATIVVDVSNVVLISDVISKIGMMCEIHEQNTNHIRSRLMSRYRQIHVCIVLDNLSPLAPTITTIFSTLQSIFAEMTLFVTAHHAMQLQDAQICELPVPALTYDHNMSSGCRLFHNIVAVTSGRMYPFEQVRVVCEQAQGNPQKIIMYANALARRGQFSEDVADPLFESLPTVAQHILVMLVIGETWMSREFVTTILALEDGNAYDSVQQLIDNLVQRHILLENLDGTMISVHDIAKELFMDAISPDQTMQMATVVMHHLNSVSSAMPAMFVVEETMWMAHWRIHEYETMLTLMKALQVYDLHAQIIAILVRWVPQCITIGLAADVLAMLEAYEPSQSFDLWYYHALVLLNSERGLLDRAQFYHDVIMQHSEMIDHVPTRQLIAAAYAHFRMNTIATEEHAQQILLMLREHSNRPSSDTDILARYAYMRVQAVISNILFITGKFADSLVYVDIALDHAAALKDPLLQLSLQNDRGITLLYLGHYRLAQSILVQLSKTYKHKQYPLKNLQVELRLAGSYWILKQPQELLVLLERNINVVIAYGTIKDMLYFLDLHIGVLELQGYAADAILLEQTMTTLRLEYRVPRGAMFDQVFTEWREQIHQELNGTEKPAQYIIEGMTVYDILNTMRQWYLEAQGAMK